MRKRTRSREFALQILYQIDITGWDYKDSLETFWNFNPSADIDDKVKEFTALIVAGVIKNSKDIDDKISSFAENWHLKRMAVVDRNIMRMACFEMLFCSDIPRKVSINEAVELAKKYSGVEAAKFVNGILDKIKKVNQ